MASKPVENAASRCEEQANAEKESTIKIPKRKLRLLGNESFSHLMELGDVNIIVEEKSVPQASIRSSKLLLARCAYFEKAFTNGMKESLDNDFHYELMEQESVDAAVIFLEIMSALDREKAVQHVVDASDIRESSSDIKTLHSVVSKLGQVLEQKLQAQLVYQMLRRTKRKRNFLSVLSWHILDWGEVEVLDSSFFYFKFLKLFHSTANFITQALFDDDLPLSRLPQEVCRQIWCSYLTERELVTSSADCFILAHISGDQDLMDKIIEYLPPAFSQYLWQLDSKAPYWWVPYLEEKDETYIPTPKLPCSKICQRLMPRFFCDLSAQALKSVFNHRRNKQKNVKVPDKFSRTFEITKQDVKERKCFEFYFGGLHCSVMPTLRDEETELRFWFGINEIFRTSIKLSWSIDGIYLKSATPYPLYPSRDSHYINTEAVQVAFEDAEGNIVPISLALSISC